MLTARRVWYVMKPIVFFTLWLGTACLAVWKLGVYGAMTAVMVLAIVALVGLLGLCAGEALCSRWRDSEWIIGDEN